MTDIKILQGQFEAAAQKYPGLDSIIIQKSKTGDEPPDIGYSLKDWIGLYNPGVSRTAKEKGYPSKHFLLLSSCFEESNVVNDLCRSLTTQAGKLLIDLPELKDLWIEMESEYWILALHRIYAYPRSIFVVTTGELFDISVNGIKYNERPPKKGEGYVEKLENVFLKSALFCGKLSEIVKELPKELPKEPITLGEFIEITLGIYRASNKNLRSMLSKYKSTGQIEYPNEVSNSKPGKSKRYNPADLYLYYKKWRQDIPTLPKFKTPD